MWSKKNGAYVELASENLLCNNNEKYPHGNKKHVPLNCKKESDYLDREIHTHTYTRKGETAEHLDGTINSLTTAYTSIKHCLHKLHVMSRQRRKLQMCARQDAAVFKCMRVSCKMFNSYYNCHPAKANVDLLTYVHCTIMGTASRFSLSLAQALSAKER